MTISFDIDSRNELRTIIDALDFAIAGIAEGRLFSEDGIANQLIQGVLIDRVAVDMVASYHHNQETAEFSVVAIAFNYNKNGEYTHAECEYCKNRKDVENAIQLFLDKGFDESEISVKRLDYCSPRHNDLDDDDIFTDDSPTILNDDDLDDDCFTDFSDDDT